MYNIKENTYNRVCLGIVGSLDFNNYLQFVTHVNNTIMELWKTQGVIVSEVVSGGARGADTMARVYALENSIPMIEFYPYYELYGRKAPLFRNTEIVDQSDILIAFPTSSSRGTWDSVRKAKKKLIPVYIYYV